MFWRRSKRGGDDGAAASASAGADDGLDDMAKLQRQFGIKPVSDADVACELQQLLGAAGGGAESPTAQLLRMMEGHGADDDEDDEARILRELQISGSADLDAVELPSEDEDGGDEEEHADDVRRVIAEAQRNHERQAEAIASGDARGIAAAVSGGNGDVTVAGATPERVRELKMRALQLKREGDVPAALAMLREAKQMEASLAPAQTNASSIGLAPPAASAARASSVAAVSVASARSISAGVAASVNGGMGSRQQLHMRSSVEVSHHLHDEPEEVDVEVTDEDMQDPEFLAQLAGFGHVEASDPASVPPVDPAQLETQIGALKSRTLQLKRENRIQEALACMRSMKELERQRDQLQATQVAATPAFVPYMVDRAPQTNIEVSDTPVRTPVAVTHAYAAPAFRSNDQNGDGDSDSDVNVTEDDMNDPSFQDELAKLGFSDDAADGSTQKIAEESCQPSPITLAASHASPRRVPQLRTIESVDEDGLIDEFESDDSDKDDGGGGWKASSAPSYRPLETAPNASATAPHSMPTTSSAGESSVADLRTQLDRARRAALELKRAGKLNEALESLRRAKQIETLIQLKQTAGIPTTTHVPVQGPQQDPAVALKFQELEQLLVEFGNRAMEAAKENLSSDRVAAAAWLKKRKEYAAQLEVLRAKRQDPFQLPPQFSVSKTSRQIEFELPQIPDDCIRVEIKAVNDLPPAAGRDVYVQFSLSFPASAPHEAQTDPIRIQPGAPHSSGSLDPSRVYQFKLQRSRGTLRLFEIKKASFEVWRPGTLFRNPELIARGYQGLSPLLSKCEIAGRIPFVGTNRKPTGGDIEVALQLRRPLRDKEIREELTDELVIGDYPVPVRPVDTNPLPQLPTVTQQALPTPQVKSSAQAEVAIALEEAETQPEALDPHDLELIVSYDVINEELEKIEGKLPSLKGVQASELRDRLDSLALKKQLLEIDMQTGKLTLEMYTARLHDRIAEDRRLIASLMRLGRRSDAARVLHRVKIMEKELEGAADGEEEGVEF